MEQHEKLEFRKLGIATHIIALATFIICSSFGWIYWGPGLETMLQQIGLTTKQNSPVIQALFWIFPRCVGAFFAVGAYLIMFKSVLFVFRLLDGRKGN